MNPDCDRWNKNAIDGFHQFFKSSYLEYPKSNELGSKFKLIISKKMWGHDFGSVVGSYIFTFLDTYLFFFSLSYVLIIHLLQRGRGGGRNQLSIDYGLNRIYPSTNNISPPNAERGFRTKFEILLEGVF